MNTTTQSIISAAQCRLCNGDVKNKFTLKILNKYDVMYFQCQSCHSLQTESPYWLAEAYKINLSNLDTGAAQRNWHNFFVIYLLCKVFNLNDVFDLGGGDGLLCRLLRDYEINCFVKDEYATPTYAQGFTEPNFDIPDPVLGFEVWEHLPNPVDDLERFFTKKPKALLITTTPYENQGEDWWYLSAETGQHIFFYSSIGLEFIAKKYGYELHIIDNLLLFVNNDLASKMKTKLYIFKKSLRGKLNRFLKYKILMKNTSGVWNDYLIQKSLVEQSVKKLP
jgi:hypothetical protein